MSLGLMPRRTKLDHSGTRLTRGEATLARGAGPKRAVGKHHAETLGEAAHGVGGAQERADARAGVVLERTLDDLALRGLATQEAGAQGLGLGRLDLVVARSGGHKGGGQVDAGRGHEHGRNDLVAAAHVDDAVKAALADDHGLAGVGDDFAMRQAVAHARVALGHAVAHADGVELNGLAAGLEDALLDLGSKLAERLMARADLIPAVGDGNEGLIGVLQGVNGHASGGQVRLGDCSLEGLELVNSTLHCALFLSLKCLVAVGRAPGLPAPAPVESDDARGENYISSYSAA